MAVLILFLLPVAKAAGQFARPKQPSQSKEPRPAADSMSIWQARRALVASIVAAHPGSLTVDPNSFRFTRDSFEFDGELRKNRERFKVDLKTLGPVIAKRGFSPVYRVKDEAGRDLPSPLNHLEYWGNGHRAADAQSLADALNRLRSFVRATDTLRTFPQQAAAWRALASKPPVPEEVRVQRLLAENAVKEKKPEEALSHYETGLELYPTWPQGYFNAALINAELGAYAEAIEYMQAYLELVPDAPDAQAARDQIVIWKYKAK